MQGKIALEEHYAIEDTLQDSNGYLPSETWEELSGRLMDIEGRRIDEMDQNGVEMMILSLNAPAVQAIYDRNRANEIAKKSNDMLAEWVQRNPGRFRGFAALPLQDVDMGRGHSVMAANPPAALPAARSTHLLIDRNMPGLHLQSPNPRRDTHG